MKQRWTALAVVSIVALLPAFVSAQSGRPRVVVNETPVPFSVSPQVEHGVLMAPLGPLASSFGATVAWEGDAREGTVTSRAGVEVRLAVGDGVALVAGTRVTLPVAPARRTGTVWVPAGALLRALGAYVRFSEGPDVVEALSQVTRITWRRGTGGLVLRIATTGLVKTQTRVLTAPDRIAVDILHAVASLKESKIEVHDPDVVAIRAAQFSVRPYVTRIVLDLSHPIPYTVAVDREGVAVTVSEEVSTRVPAPPPPVPALTTPPPSHPGPTLTTPPPPHPDPTLTIPPPSHEERPHVEPQGEPMQTDREHPNGAAAPEPLAAAAIPEFADGPGAFHIRAVRYEIEGKEGRLTVVASQPVPLAVVRQLEFPERLAIDLPGGVFIPRREDLEVGSDAVRNIVVAQLQVGPNATRVLIYLRHKTTFTAVSTDGGRVLTFTFGDIPRTAERAPSVVIDAGHGGMDSGAVGPTGLREADVTLGIGRMVQQALERQGVRVVLTRTDDSTVGLEDRPDIARREGGIIFVSIHANASVSAAKKGTETYYRTHESAELATAVQSEVVRALGEPDRGIRTADFYVLVNAPMPAVLIETAFISNPTEERLLRDPVVQQRIADGIARAIVQFLGARTAVPAP